MVDSRRPKLEANATCRLVLAFLCIGLVVIGSMIQVTHSHSDHSSSHADCSLCVVAHGSAVAAAPTITVITVTMVSQLEAPSPVTQPQALLPFALFTRPPPVDIVPA
jgi:hypothetical protein